MTNDCSIARSAACSLTKTTTSCDTGHILGQQQLEREILWYWPIGLRDERQPPYLHTGKNHWLGAQQTHMV